MSIIASLFRRTIPQPPRQTNEYNYVYARLDRTVCYYCGNSARAFDHVLPISIARLLPYFKFSSELLQLVPCCTRCNSIASNRFFTSLAAKRQFVRQRINELSIRARYAKIMDELYVALRR